MSFEGEYQLLCTNHHLYGADLYIEGDGKYCDVCNTAPIWYALIDLTNGSIDDEGNDITGYVHLEEKTPAIYCECSCGHRHIKEHPTYHLPAEGVGHRIE